MKLYTSGDSVFELSQAKLSGHGFVDFLVGLEEVVVRSLKKYGVVVFLVVVVLLVVIVLLVVVVLLVVAVARGVELRNPCDNGSFAGRHQF